MTRTQIILLAYGAGLVMGFVIGYFWYWIRKE